MLYPLKKRFLETYRIFPETYYAKSGQWRVEVGTPECLFAFASVSKWFTTEHDAQAAARLAERIIELVDNVLDEFECELLSSSKEIDKKFDIELVETIWENVLNYARKTRIDENHFPPTDTGTEDNDAPF